MNRRVSISTALLQDKYGDRRALEIAREIGADAVDFSLHRSCNVSVAGSLYAEGDDAVRAYFSELGDYAASLGVEIHQTHGRLKGFYNDPRQDAILAENGRLDCLATAAIGAKCCVFHTTTTGSMGPFAPRELMHALNDKTFFSLLPHARKNGILAATETFGDSPKYGCCDFFGCMDEFVEAYDRVAREFDDCFRVCMDTGHTNKAMRFSGNPTPGDAIRRLGKRIAVLHLHDNDGMTDQHKIPMTGSIDWNDVFDALDEIGYNGVYNLEIALKHFGEGFEIEEAAFAVKVMRQMLKQRYGA